MQATTKLGVSRPLGALAALALLLILCASTSGGSVGRNLSRQEMLTSFGGDNRNTILCCGFNSGCYFPNTQTTSFCTDLTNLGQSYCTAITDYTGNNSKRCTVDDQATSGTCTNAGQGNSVVCSKCWTCTWDTILGCIIDDSCGNAYNYSGCQDTCQ
jgi:hypothetical protein